MILRFLTITADHFSGGGSNDLKNHAVWGSLSRFKVTLDAFDDVKKTDERFTALTKLYDYIYWILNESDPWLISTVELDHTSKSNARKLVMP